MQKQSRTQEKKVTLTLKNVIQDADNANGDKSRRQFYEVREEKA